MKILLTGAAGFIGTHVRKILVEHGHEVFTIDCFESRVHGAAPDKSGMDFTYPCCYITPEELNDVVPEVVVHLAAQVGVADSMTDPNRYVTGNVADTTMFLERLAKMKRPPRKIIVASSMSVYGDPHTSDPIGEEWPTTPASVYGLTKYDQERLVLMLAPLMGATPVALRFFNVYGPGQALTNPYTGVLANFANNIFAGKPPIVYEDGLQTRDFIYVEDVAYAVVGAVEQDMEGVYNVCTGHAETILGVAETMCRALNHSTVPHLPGETRPGDVRHCIGRNLKLRLALPRWEPMPFASGMALYAQHLLASTQAPADHTAPLAT